MLPILFCLTYVFQLYFNANVTYWLKHYSGRKAGAQILHNSWITAQRNCIHFSEADISRREEKRQKRISFWFSNPSLISFPVCVLVCLFCGSYFSPKVDDCTAVVKSNGGIIADRGKHSILIGACALRPSEVHSPQLREHLIAQHQ